MTTTTPTPAPARGTAERVTTWVSFGMTALVLACFGFVHLIFWGFGGEVFVWDSVYPVLTGVVWAAALAGTIVLRHKVRIGLLWAVVSLGAVGVLIIVDIVRFAALFGSASS